MVLLIDLLGGLIVLLTPVVGLLIFFIILEEFRPLAHAIHLNQRIVLAFIIGCVFAVGSIPVIASGRGWIMLNMSGAVMPTCFAIYLWIKNKLNIFVVSIGIGATAFVTYKVTKIVDNIGIGAEFPDYLLPVLTAVIISTAYGLLSKREKALPISFTVACLGTLTGADLVRIPELVFNRGLGGDIGGARTLDLVLICPLLAFFLTFILLFLTKGFCKRKLLRDYPYRLPKANRDDRWIHKRFIQGYDCLKQGQRKQAIFYALDAVKKKIYMVAGFQYSKPNTLRDKDILLRVLDNPRALGDFYILEKFSRELDPTTKKAYKSLLTAQLLLDKLDSSRKVRLATKSRRAGAFLIDQICLLPFAALINIIWISSLYHPVNPDETISTLLVYFIFPFSIWASLQLPYFILFELFTNRTPGKWMVGIEVKEIGKTRMSFEAAIARNISRYFEMLGGFYIFSVIVMGFSKNRQRIGDMIAKTVVVPSKNRAGNFK